MLINITDADPKTKLRKLVVTEDKEVFSASIHGVAAGHRLAKIGLKHGWDSDELAKAAKDQK